ncbi:hypothetical protein PQR05_29595 [Paraburkholderia sediminicola]|uniref:GIY-YIG nuclease family protein n=1 Tax=Paraburkholderia sediminicola TaxID=458836 RepID=UPI0038BC9E80
MHDKPTALYRHFDAEDKLLYVGISLSAANRLAQHMQGSEWAGQIAKVTVTPFPNRSEAKTAETYAIQNEMPLWNKAENPSRYVDFKDEFKIRLQKPKKPKLQWNEDLYANLIANIVAATEHIEWLGEQGAVRSDFSESEIALTWRGLKHPLDRAKMTFALEFPNGGGSIQSAMRWAEDGKEESDLMTAFVRAEDVQSRLLIRYPFPPDVTARFVEALDRYGKALLAIPEQVNQAQSA